MTTSNTTAASGIDGEMKRRILGFVIGLGAMMYFLTSTPPEGLNVTAWRTIGVTCMMGAWWMLEAIPISATAFLPLVLFPMLGIQTATKVAPSYAGDLIFLFMGGFVIAIAMEMWNLHRRVSLNILKIAGANPGMLVLGFMVATGFLSAWMSNTACATMMMPIGMAIISLLNNGKDEKNSVDDTNRKFGICIMLGIAFSASIGGLMTPIGTPPNAVLVGQMSKIAGIDIGFGNFMMIGVPIAVVLMTITWLLLIKVFFPVKGVNLDKAVSVVDEELEKLGPLSRGEALVMLIFVLTAACWMFRSKITGAIGTINVAGTEIVAGRVIRDSTIAMTAAVIMFVTPVSLKEGKFLVDSSVFNKIPWDVLVLVGGGLALGGALNSSGVSQYVAANMESVSNMSTIMIIAVCSTIVMLITQLASNTATANTFVPLGISIAVGIGQHPMMIAVPMAIGAGLAFSLPVSTPPNAIVFGSGLIRIPDMFKVGILANFIGIAIAIVVMYVMLPVAFGIKQGEMPAVPKVVQMKEAVLKNTMPNADEATLFEALQKAFPKLSADELNALLAKR